MGIDTIKHEESQVGTLAEAGAVRVGITGCHRQPSVQAARKDGRAGRRWLNIWGGRNGRGRQRTLRALGADRGSLREENGRDSLRDLGGDGSIGGDEIGHGAGGDCRLDHYGGDLNSGRRIRRSWGRPDWTLGVRA